MMYLEILVKIQNSILEVQYGADNKPTLTPTTAMSNMSHFIIPNLVCVGGGGGGGGGEVV